jgi:hypothetical protein
MQDAGEAPTTVHPAAASALSAVAPRKVLFSAMKNEAPFVLEWIAYHKAIGFDEIVICSNPSNWRHEKIGVVKRRPVAIYPNGLVQ